MSGVVDDSNLEFKVDRVFFSPTKGLCYSGRRVGDAEDLTSTITVDMLTPISGKSRVGIYDLETGEIREEAEHI